MNDEQLGRLRAYADGELDHSERGAMEQELATSPDARAALAELEALDAELRGLFAMEVREPDVTSAWTSLRRRIAPPPARRAWRSTVGILALSAAAIVVLLALWRPFAAGASSGSITSHGRQTVALGSRAIAVAESESVLAWDVDDSGATRVRQSAGAVFYRVDAGDAFVVETPSGQVTVTGTCFTVEIDRMHPKLRHLASASVGAALATGLLLTVHEGHVVLANDHGDVDVGAGQSARAQADRAPALDEDAASGIAGSVVTRSTSEGRSTSAGRSAYASLVQENSAQRRQLRRLEAELARLTQADAGGERKPGDRDSAEARREAAHQCGEAGSCDERVWTDPSEEELVALAKCGRLLVDTPPFGLGPFPHGGIIEAAGLSEAEANRYAEIATAFEAESGRALKSFAAELGAPASLTDRMSITQLIGLVDSVVDDEVHEATRRRLANERAGLSAAPPIADQSAGERAIRFQAGLGGAFEQRLAIDFGADAAREMRRADGGWGSKSSIGDGECAQ